MAPLRSMTGFAQVQRTAEGCTVGVQLRAVNHRYLDIRWQLPPELEAAQADLEKQLRAALVRGHIEVRCVCTATGAAGSGWRLDPDIVAAYADAHDKLSRRFGADVPVSATDLLRFPGAFTAAAAPDVAPATWAALAREALAAALTELVGMREREGAALATDLRHRLREMQTARAALADLRLELEAGLRERLELRLRELLGAAAPSSDRLVQEAALLADRSDISEELTRLAAHLAQCLAFLEEGGEVGKKLDFLSQELNREVNTLLAKTTSASRAGLQVSEIGLGLKAALEKFREQVQNLE